MSRCSWEQKIIKLFGICNGRLLLSKVRESRLEGLFSKDILDLGSNIFSREILQGWE